MSEKKKKSEPKSKAKKPLTECVNCSAEVPVEDTHSCPDCGNDPLCPECVCEECPANDIYEGRYED
jgi:rRNA maturation endonuclease Nob1